MTTLNVIKDQPNSFGWISIGLHWATAAVVIAMWFIGQSITEQTSLDGVAARRNLHIITGLTSWVLLAGRIYWRTTNSHPHVAGQSQLTHRIARFVHYAMLGLLSIVITTGPLMALLDSDETRPTSILHLLHSYSANTLFALVVLHILASLKHLMFHHDDTIIRMIRPKK